MIVSFTLQHLCRQSPCPHVQGFDIGVIRFLNTRYAPHMATLLDLTHNSLVNLGFLARPIAKAKLCSPPPKACLGLFGGGKVPQQEFLQPHKNYLTSINCKIVCLNNGNVLVAQELLDALQA